MRKSISLLASLSFGLLYPSAVYSLESPAVIASPAIAQTVDADFEASELAITSELALEERIQDLASGDSREYTFRGNANELIVVYIEASRGYSYSIRASIIDADGEQVEGEYAYHEGLDFAEYKGRHTAFLLPQTGEYRLVITNQEYTGESVQSSEYLVRARVAPYVERLMIYGLELIDEERFEEAISVFGMAIEESPEQPLPYMARALSYAIPRFEDLGSDDFSEDADEFEVVYDVFSRIDAETQALIVSDMKQSATVMNALIDEGKITLEDVDIHPGLLSEGAAFFETGVASVRLRELFNDFFGLPN